jgi:hypothetical protein
MVFGVFAILGYRFSPRIADIGDTRYWRAGWPGDPDGDYGPLNAIARNRVNPAKIVEVWPDMLRVAGSLITHQVRGYDVLAMLGRDGRPTPLGQGFIEYGRIAKTLHLLAMIDRWTTLTGARSTPRPRSRSPATGWPARSSTATAARCISATERARKTSWGALGIVLNAATLSRATVYRALQQADWAKPSGTVVRSAAAG